jgi:hypothetical protein
MQKIDVLLPAYRAYSQVRQEKAQRHPLEQGSRSFRIASPEDMVLVLLEQYKGGGRPIPRLRDTTLEILRAQGKQLDLPYLRVWATALDVASLLERALVSVGLSKA